MPESEVFTGSAVHSCQGIARSAPCGRPATHHFGPAHPSEEHRGRHYCCRCYVEAGFPPSMEHPGCMLAVST